MRTLNVSANWWCDEDTSLQFDKPERMQKHSCESVCVLGSNMAKARLLRQYIHSIAHHFTFVVFTLANKFPKCAIRTHKHTYKWRRGGSTRAHTFFPTHTTYTYTNRPVEFHPKNKGWAKTIRTRTNQYLIWLEFFFLCDFFFFGVWRESIFNFHRSGVVLVGLSQMAVESCGTSVRRCSRLMCEIFSIIFVSDEKMDWIEREKERKGNGKGKLFVATEEFRVWSERKSEKRKKKRNNF